MANIHIGVIINGATGRMGTTQHMAHLLAIAKEGGLRLKNGDRLIPELTLVGRNADSIKALAAAHGVKRATIDLDEALSGPEKIFMDCSATGGRPERVRKAIAAGKHIHIEKPTAPTVEEAMELARLAHKAGLKHGVIQDKLYLPGYAKLLFVKNSGFFGRILSVRVDAGSWIFDGTTQECQRPSWNYRKKDGGGLALDMMAHWRYMIDRLVSPITAVSAMMETAIPERVDEQGNRYKVDAEDTVYAMLRTKDGAIGQITNSWASRPRRADTMMVHIDGTDGSAVGRPLPVLHPGRGQHAGGVHQGGAAGRRRPAGALGRSAGHVRPQAAVPPALGKLPAPCRRGCAAGADPGRRRQGRAARGPRLQERRRAALDRRAGAQPLDGGVLLPAACSLPDHGRRAAGGRLVRLVVAPEDEPRREAAG